MQKFHLHQTTNSFPTELEDETAWQVYSHIRTRLGLEAAEKVQRMLEETGSAHLSDTDSLGTQYAFDIRPSR
jgi:hypothetical protein